MLKRAKDGTPVRKHLEAAARMGDASAVEQLAGPECPDSMLYLVGWSYELYARSGVGMGGPAPLSYREIQAWADLTGNDPDFLEVSALIALDRVLLEPDAESEGEKAAEPQPIVRAEAPAWPAKKG
jgi:hypothetical protein